ncbi:MAG: class I SAM-dependent methyltransferase [Chitinophagales bacterium]|nr:class I SAM-dependent methyltransferase [Chitinophagales bacterium]
MIDIIHKCRCCESKNIIPIHDFGKVPIADHLTTENTHIETFPLSTVFCTDCFHFQILENIAPTILFQNNYPYYSSKIPEVVQHFKTTYLSILKNISINSDDSIIEIAANDGVLITQFSSHSTQLVAIEPSKEHALITQKKGIQTFNQFFNKENATTIFKQLRKYPRLILACNVLAHVPDPKDFVEGLTILSDYETNIVIEVPHALPMFKNGLFDVIFHQHFSYFNLYSIKKLFEKYHFFINHVEQIDTQGGSLRIYISKNKIKDNTIHLILKEEQDFHLYDLQIYHQFSERIKQLKIDTILLLQNLKSSQNTVVGYGAPGKASNYLNYFGINKIFFDALIDISPSKQGKYFPNTDLKIYSLDYFKDHEIDYIFILSWNYAETIISNLNYLREKGTRFIIGIPQLNII